MYIILYFMYMREEYAIRTEKKKKVENCAIAIKGLYFILQLSFSFQKTPRGDCNECWLFFTGICYFAYN